MNSRCCSVSVIDKCLNALNKNYLFVIKVTLCKYNNGFDLKPIFVDAVSLRYNKYWTKEKTFEERRKEICCLYFRSKHILLAIAQSAEEYIKNMVSWARL